MSQYQFSLNEFKILLNGKIFITLVDYKNSNAKTTIEVQDCDLHTLKILLNLTINKIEAKIQGAQVPKDTIEYQINNTPIFTTIDLANKCLWIHNKTIYTYFNFMNIMTLLSGIESICNMLPLIKFMKNNEINPEKLISETIQQNIGHNEEIKETNKTDDSEYKKDIDIEKIAEIANILITVNNQDENTITELSKLVSEYCDTEIKPNTLKVVIDTIKDTIERHLKEETIFDVVPSIIANPHTKDLYSKYIQHETDKSKQLKYLVALIFWSEVITVINMSKGF